MRFGKIMCCSLQASSCKTPFPWKSHRKIIAFLLLSILCDLVQNHFCDWKYEKQQIFYDAVENHFLWEQVRIFFSFFKRRGNMEVCRIAFPWTLHKRAKHALFNAVTQGATSKPCIILGSTTSVTRHRNQVTWMMERIRYIHVQIEYGLLVNFS